ncbi:MAG: peptide deformylase [Bacteroidetes bacterium SW_11_45_7]|nr:MAG: peptide deformylase [Bacteroidetes bacterium SW_11_45_7]
MLLPIEAYGSSALRKVGEEVPEDYPQLQELIDNMLETMYNAPGVGLAAPQLNLALRLFVIDSTQFYDEEDEEETEEKGLKEVFINPEIIEKYGEDTFYEEGCLSIPGIREQIVRPSQIHIQYYDRDFNFHDEQFEGLDARVIQHEYDHINGVLFTDHLKPIKKRTLQKSLNEISQGKVKVQYKMRFPKQQKKRV